MGWDVYITLVKKDMTKIKYIDSKYEMIIDLTPEGFWK